LKNIEKHQTLPTKAMLDTLFQEISKVEVLEEKEDGNAFTGPLLISRDTELEQYRNRYEEMQLRLGTHKNRVLDLLERMTYVKGTFGKGYYKLDIDQSELENFKKQL